MRSRVRRRTLGSGTREFSSPLALSACIHAYSRGARNGMGMIAGSTTASAATPNASCRRMAHPHSPPVSAWTWISAMLPRGQPIARINAANSPYANACGSITQPAIPVAMPMTPADQAIHSALRGIISARPVAQAAPRPASRVATAEVRGCRRRSPSGPGPEPDRRRNTSRRSHG